MSKSIQMVCKYDHITLILKSLHWFPVPFRIDYSPISASMVTPPFTYRNSSPSKPPHALSVLQQHTLSKPPEPNSTAWVTRLFAQ